MAQNLATLNPDPNRWAALDQAIQSIMDHTEDMAGPPSEALRRAPKMGDKSESFCRESTAVLAHHPQILPPTFNLDDMRADLDAFDALRPRVIALTRLLQRMETMQTALGSDVMAASLKGYKFLQVAGKHQGLEPLRKGLSTRFTGQGKRNKAPTPPPTDPTE